MDKLYMKIQGGPDLYEKDRVELEELVLDALGRALGPSHTDINRRPMPEPEHIGDLVQWVAIYKYSSMTTDDLKQIREELKKSLEDRRVLDESAAVLKREMETIQAYLKSRDARQQPFENNLVDRLQEQRLNQIKSALPALEAPIALVRYPGGARESPRGPGVKPWTQVARGLARETQKVLRAAGGDPKTFGGKDGVVVRFIGEALTWMPRVWEDERRSNVAPSTILDAINTGPSRGTRKKIELSARNPIQPAVTQRPAASSPHLPGGGYSPT